MKYLKLFETFNFYKEDFPYGLNNIPEEVFLYRILGLENLEEIDYNNLGLHYVADENLLNDNLYRKPNFAASVSADIFFL